MSRTNAALLVLFFAVLVWSAVRPHDYFTWSMEVFPASLYAGMDLDANY